MGRRLSCLDERRLYLELVGREDVQPGPAWLVVDPYPSPLIPIAVHVRPVPALEVPVELSMELLAVRELVRSLPVHPPLKPLPGVAGLARKPIATVPVLQVSQPLALVRRPVRVLHHSVPASLSFQPLPVVHGAGGKVHCSSVVTLVVDPLADVLVPVGVPALSLPVPHAALLLPLVLSFVNLPPVLLPHWGRHVRLDADRPLLDDRRLERSDLIVASHARHELLEDLVLGPGLVDHGLGQRSRLIRRPLHLGLLHGHPRQLRLPRNLRRLRLNFGEVRGVSEGWGQLESILLREGRWRPVLVEAFRQTLSS
mmetsp:Transcript_13615/g.47291  ORF Transcript_13615/g.47291 Transcript_13615/m.47291 type:complete len:312 (-) Transcript_13615:98-1033(-)